MQNQNSTQRKEAKETVDKHVLALQKDISRLRDLCDQNNQKSEQLNHQFNTNIRIINDSLN